MSSKKNIHCQICGDVMPPKSGTICADCQQRTAQPAVGAQVAREFTCADCGVRFILATGELVSHRDTRYCVTCWRAQRYTGHVTYATRYDSPIGYKQEEIRERTPDWAIELGLDWPCSLDDVERRSRELAKATHPDLGGDHTKFIIKRGFVEQARTWFAQQEGG